LNIFHVPIALLQLVHKVSMPDLVRNMMKIGYDTVYIRNSVIYTWLVQSRAFETIRYQISGVS
jgi:hypothetical protein